MQKETEIEQVALMPVERSYDVRAKQIIAFNECRKSGGDLDDALDAAYKVALRYTPAPADKDPPLIQALHANGDLIALQATVAQQAQRIADLEADKGQGEPVATLARKYDDTLLPFVALMRKELHANAAKGDRPGWLSMTADTCLLEIIYHFGKLQASVKRGDGDGMAEYGADVANMCMMLLDICGVINLVQHTEQPAPVANGTTSDKYKAELYEEVWQKARDMGFANVTDALTRLDEIDEFSRLNPELKP